MKTTFDAKKELEFLNGLVQDYTDSSPYSELKKAIIVDLMLEHFDRPDASGLQFGCANGYETSRLAASLGTLDVVDGSSVFIERLEQQEKGANISFHCALFEDYHHQSRGRTYDRISCNYVMEHVFDPAQILGNIRTMMHAESLLFITVPNSDALSRRLALEMGLITSLDGLTENDHKHGHRRTYTFESLRAEVAAAGFTVVKETGIVFKILADFQLNALLKSGVLNAGHIHGLQGLAQVPENLSYSDSIFCVLRKN